MLNAETQREIDGFIRSGFYEKARLMEIVCEEMYEPGELEPADVSAVIDKLFSDWEKDKKTWPAVTDCDRLDQAFEAINERGVVALQNAGYTQSDGFEDCSEVIKSRPDKGSIQGYCFYHGQDLERAVHGDGLWIAFGPLNPKDEKTKGVEVGAIVKEELERAGLKVRWDGTFDKRIEVYDLVWQRR